MELRGKKILITGGSLGIGKACAKLLIENGAQVAITGRNESRLMQTADELGAVAIPGDVSSPSDVDRTFSEIESSLGSLDCLINNAGFGKRSELLDVTEEEMRSIWETNVLGATLMAQGAARIFVKQKYGNIINIASTAALRGYGGGSMYCSSKFALRGLSECWRAELRPHNVRVVTICPSEVTTAFGSADGTERSELPNRLRAIDIAHMVKSVLEMDDRGFVPELSVFATNPW